MKKWKYTVAVTKQLLCSFEFWKLRKNIKSCAYHVTTSVLSMVMLILMGCIVLGMVIGIGYAQIWIVSKLIPAWHSTIIAHSQGDKAGTAIGIVCIEVLLCIMVCGIAHKFKKMWNGAKFEVWCNEHNNLLVKYPNIDAWKIFYSSDTSEEATIALKKVCKTYGKNS